MRLSDAEREQLFEQLSRHAAAGRIGMEELERRVAAIDAAESREHAAELMADLPPLGPGAPGAPAAGPAARRRWGRGHGHGATEGPRPDWQPTSERFRDPGTGQVMRVWVDAGGGRHYVVDEDP